MATLNVSTPIVMDTDAMKAAIAADAASGNTQAQQAIDDGTANIATALANASTPVPIDKDNMKQGIAGDVNSGNNSVAKDVGDGTGDISNSVASGRNAIGNAFNAAVADLSAKFNAATQAISGFKPDA